MTNPFSKFGDLMQQAKEMQQKIKKMQEELNTLHVIGEAGAGLVQLTVNGNGEALSINIDEAVYKESKQILQGLLIAAINDANHKREIKKKELMGGMVSGMGLPPGFDFLTNVEGS